MVKKNEIIHSKWWVSRIFVLPFLLFFLSDALYPGGFDDLLVEVVEMIVEDGKECGKENGKGEKNTKENEKDIYLTLMFNCDFVGLSLKRCYGEHSFLGSNLFFDLVTPPPEQQV
ncbi:hypothetical protein [Xanthovirga aplysinae]|uniref:hypothetical protein n=1 Tax=Xanthovirga aplysinae TaxID=2529853 RepID=UPI0012BB6CB6|nr:hypothetical protein [Xanthovirga aplysinae]MTI32161.1 hypothetical protein [Xanthovirga aplysinae]